MADIIDLAGYKAAKGISPSVTTFDGQLSALIGMANDFIPRYCNRQFGDGVFTERNPIAIDANGSYLFVTKNRPISAITAVTIYFYGMAPLQSFQVNLAYLNIFNADGFARYSFNLIPVVTVIREEYRYNGYYDITYSVSGTSIPPALTFAAVNMVSDTFNYYFGDQMASGTGSPSREVKHEKIGDYSIDFETGVDKLRRFSDVKSGMLLTKTTMDLLRPFKNSGQSQN